MKRPGLSALLISYNEERNIKLFIEDVTFADEIIIVDSHSDDKTMDIARSFPNVQIYQRVFHDFSSQKNYALSLATHEWILFLDADERMNNPLKEEILQTISRKDTHDAYYIRIKCHFMEKTLKYSGFQNQKSVRLLKKSRCRYDSSKLVHEKIHCQGTLGTLKNTLIHYTYVSWDQYDGKLTKYAILQANELFSKGIYPNLFHFIFKPWYRFFNHYILRRGILDSWEGFFVSCIYSFYVFKRYVFLWMKYKRIR